MTAATGGGTRAPTRQRVRPGEATRSLVVENEPVGGQRAVTEAARRAGVTKRVPCHTFRHSLRHISSRRDTTSRVLGGSLRRHCSQLPLSQPTA